MPTGKTSLAVSASVSQALCALQQFTQVKTTKATEVAFAQPAQRRQLRVWSTNLFFLIQGIMARRVSPTCSI